MEEIRQTLDDRGCVWTQTPGQAADLTLPSSGLVWTIPELYKRYAFLRKLAQGPKREEVRFDLLYYPYWFLIFREQVSWQVFGKSFGTRQVEHLRIQDARTGKSLKLVQPPDNKSERIVFPATAPGQGKSGETSTCDAGAKPFVAATIVRDGQEAVSACTHVAPALLDKEAALEKAGQDAARAMAKSFGRPLGFLASITPVDSSAFFLCKPFWIMRSYEHAERIFVFDASTGLGGVAEYWNVVDYLTSSHTTTQTAMA